MYEFTKKIGYSDCDSDWKLTPYGLVDYFQDCSTFQSEELSMGEAFVRANHAAWVLASWDIRIFSLPSHMSTVRVATWPYKFNLSFGYRNYTLKGENDELFACADSQWIYFDLQKLRPIRLPKDVQDGYRNVIEEKLPYEFAPRKIALPEGFTEEEPFLVRQGDIDTNCHVNNAAYLRMAMDYLPESAALRQIRIEYVKAAVLSDRIFPSVCRDADRIVIRLDSAEKKPYAVIEARCNM